MFDALYISATGMQAQQQNVDAVANNLANVNTPGYKKTRVSFTDLVAAGAQPQVSDPAAAGDSRRGPGCRCDGASASRPVPRER